MSAIKIIVMGVGGVGKSAITNRFVVGRWVEKVCNTIKKMEFDLVTSV
jgi:GTPase SAR1 family protein